MASKISLTIPSPKSSSSSSPSSLTASPSNRPSTPLTTSSLPPSRVSLSTLVSNLNASGSSSTNFSVACQIFSSFLCCCQYDAIATLRQMSELGWNNETVAKIEHNKYLCYYYYNKEKAPEKLLKNFEIIYQNLRHTPLKTKFSLDDLILKEKEILKTNPTTKTQFEELRSPFSPLESSRFYGSGGFAETIANDSILLYNCAILLMKLKKLTSSINLFSYLTSNLDIIEDTLAIKICFCLLEIFHTLKKSDDTYQVLQILQRPNAFITFVSERHVNLSLHHLGRAEGTNKATATDKTLKNRYVSILLHSFANQKYWNLYEMELLFYIHFYRCGFLLETQDIQNAKQEFEEMQRLYHQYLKDIDAWHVLTLDPCKILILTQAEPFSSTLLAYVQYQHTRILYTLQAKIQYYLHNIDDALSALESYRYDFAGLETTLSTQPGFKELIEKKVYEKCIYSIHFEKINPFSAAFLASYYNNIGCVYFRDGKYAIASIIFEKARQATLQALLPKASTVSLSGFLCPGIPPSNCWSDVKAEISYNLGLTALMEEKLDHAFLHFEYACRHFPLFCHVWIRLAECCILFYKKWDIKRNQDQFSELQIHDFKVSTPKQFVKQDEYGLNVLTQGDIGKRISRQYRLCRHHVADSNSWVYTEASEWLPALCSYSETNTRVESNRSLSKPELNDGSHKSKLLDCFLLNGKDALNYARQYLENVLSILNYKVQNDSQTKSNKYDSTLKFAASMSKHKEAEHSRLEDATYTKLAFVTLCQNDFGASLQYSTFILNKYGIDKNTINANNLETGNLQSISVTPVSLSLLYSVEALISLNRIDEAVQLLRPCAEQDCIKKWADQQSKQFNDSTTFTTSSANSLLFMDPSSMNSAKEFLQYKHMKCILYCNLAHIYVVKKDFNSALQSIEVARSLFPKAIAPLRTLLYIHLVKGDGDEALKLIREYR